MKDVELKLIGELMKNSRRSDRQLAEVVGVSQPTVSRTIRRLEEEGVIKDYTMIPDFRKLGYHIMAILFLKRKSVPPEKRDEMLKTAQKLETQNPRSSLLVMNGQGIEKDAAVIMFFHDYSEYASYLQTMKSKMDNDLNLLMEPDNVESFLINLDDTTHYQPLTLFKIAAHLQKGTNQNRAPAKHTR